MKNATRCPLTQKVQAKLSALLLFTLIVVPAGCKQKLTGSNVAYIIGPTNDITSVSSDNHSDMPPNVFSATGLIVTKLQGDRVKYCSGALAAPAAPGENMRMITNHHCFAETDERGQSSDSLLVEACTGTEVYLGFAPTLGQAPVRGACLPGSLRTSASMDLAVFTLSKPLPVDIQPLEIWEGDPFPEGRPALIVHYPDVEQNLAIPPGQRTKLPAASITTLNCTSGGLFTTSEWELDRSLPYGMKHTCDLIHGSSGSPLIDAETRKIIGINWGGIKIKNDGTESVDNVATRAIFLKKFLNGENPSSGSSASSGLDAIASQRAATTTSSDKKQPNLPFGCGTVALPGVPSVWLIFVLLMPLLFCFKRSLKWRDSK